MYREIVVTILSSGLLIHPLTTNILAQSQNFQTVQIFNGQITLHPRESQGYTFSVPTSAKNIHLKGNISASGGAIKSITVRLYDS
ncbi:MAG: hypothetical protein ACJ71A_07920, partial [Nitrososphaeraceae archaeon]